MLVKHFANQKREREGRFQQCDFLYAVVAFTVVLKRMPKASGNWCMGEAQTSPRSPGGYPNCYSIQALT